MPDNISVSDNTAVAMPIRNIVSIVAAVAVSTWAYSGVIERLNRIETTQTISSTEIDANTEFRIRWPRGEMGALPADSRQDMQLEAIMRDLDSIRQEVAENDAWIDDFKPPPEVRNSVAAVQELQIRLRLLESQLEDVRNTLREQGRK